MAENNQSLCRRPASAHTRNQDNALDTLHDSSPHLHSMGGMARQLVGTHIPAVAL